MKRIFSILFNGDLRLTEWAIKSGQVKEVYFSSIINQGFSLKCDNSGIKGDEGTIKELLAICFKHKIETNLLLNQISLIYTDTNACLRYIRQLDNLSSITIGDPHAVTFFAEKLPKIQIHSSVIMDLHSINKAAEMIKRGIKAAVLPFDFARDYHKLRAMDQLKKRFSGFKIKLFISNPCFSECPFTISHFASRFYKSIKQPVKGCIGFYLKKDSCEINADMSALIKRPFVRPEDVDSLVDTGFVDYLKLIYRFENSDILQKKFKAYFERKYAGNLFDIIPFSGMGRLKNKISCNNEKFPKNFYKKVFNCRKQCFDCDYCDKVAKKVITYKNL